MHPPVTVIKTNAMNSSMGYGAKIDGDVLYIPYNKWISEKYDKKDISVIEVDRSWFNGLQTYGGA
jgi:hypothetical protein